MTATDTALLAPTAPTAVPDAAPFDAEQRAYVEGFLAALQSVRQAHTAAAASDSGPGGPGHPLTILYGSQSGNCEALAKALRKHARNRGFEPDVKPLDAIDLDDLPAVQYLLIVCSTFGEGDPPDNAKKFLEWIDSDDAAQLPGVSYSVCALGDRSYTCFCRSGKVLDDRLAELGATRLAERAECDVDYDGPYEAWRDAVFASETMAAITESAGAVVEDEPDDAAGVAAWSKANPFPATMLRVQCLSGPGSAKEVNHVEISLAGSGLEYEVGDALGLWPVNCAGDVQAILDAGGFSGEEVVAFKGEAYPLRAALLRKVDLHVLTPTVREAMGLSVKADWLRDRHLIDVLLELAPRVEAQGLVDALRPLQPRLYSIASSPKAHPQQVQLTVGAVRYDLHGRPRKGVASTFLAERCASGGTVGVYVQKSPHFRLPEDPATPIIMVGPGTGIAPFRAFLEERIVMQASGRSWLFFGDQHVASDYLYRDWLEARQADGGLTRLDLAWSRDGAEKVYVQHRMLESGAELFAWLEDGAHFYVCGDASRMAHDVDAALRQLVAEQGGLSPEDAGGYVDRLSAEHRYQRDVY